MQRAERGVMTFLLYALGFLLFWEWLRPLPVISDTGNMDIFMMYAGFVFFLSYLRLPLWITAPVQVSAMLYGLHALFFAGSPFHPKWLGYLLNDVMHNTSLLFAAEWAALSDLYRSLLFFVLLWLISYLMYYWLIQSRKVFLFFLVTVLYVTILDTFTLYDANAAIVRTVLIGFGLLALLRFYQILDEEKIRPGRDRFPLPWAVALVLVLSAAVTVGFIAPKAGPQWPDPVPFIQRAANPYGGDVGAGKAVQRIGYGANDSRLGGSFIYDDTPLFTVATEERRYWRVETKNIYTGKGWETPDSNQMVPFGSRQTSLPSLYEASVKKTDVPAEITLAEGRKFPQLVYGGELTDVKLPGDVQLKMNADTEKFRMVRDGEQLSLATYEMTFQTPEFSLETLQQPGGENRAIKGIYTQLPDSLPDRVRQLAEEVTADAENRYEKAKAVEEYFQANGFTYETDDVAVPGEDEDYTDQFLFETKAGYCDNFSTSMAVMLRAVGIPTRWVKGFTPGEYQDTLESGATVYEVTNANAHSWVEVYFPGSGWVPFEPTIGFSGIANIVSHDDGDGTVDGEREAAEPHPSPREPHEPSEQQAESRVGEGGATTGWFAGWFTSAKIILAIGILLLLAAGVAYRTRRKWLPAWVRYRFRNKNGDGVLLEAYEQLLKLLPLYDLARSRDETLREYAVTVDERLGTSEMKALTVSYERARFRGDRSYESWREKKAAWETILRRLGK